jgi:hypothetical protein
MSSNVNVTGDRREQMAVGVRVDGHVKWKSGGAERHSDDAHDAAPRATNSKGSSASVSTGR